MDFWNKLAWGALAFGAVQSAGHAASFDCSQAATRVERAICASARLSALDEELGALYRSELGRTSEAGDARDAVRNRQRSWLRMTRDTCSDMPCLEAAYVQRINTLKGPSIARSCVDMSCLEPVSPPNVAAPRTAAPSQAAAPSTPPQPAGPTATVGTAATSVQATPATTSGLVAPARRIPSNPHKVWFCATPLGSGNAAAVCENPRAGSLLQSLHSDTWSTAWEVRWFGKSVRDRLTQQMAAPIEVFLDEIEALCPGFAAGCVEPRASAAASQMRKVAGSLLARERTAQQERDRLARESSDAEPIQVNNGGAGSTHVRRHQGNFTVLYVENRTAQGLQQVDVACQLYEDWSDTKPVDAAQLRHNIVGNIAPNSSNFSTGPIPVPWNADAYGTDAQVVRCRVLKTAAANAADARTAIQKRDADERRVEAARSALLAESDRRRAEIEMDQVVRLRMALGIASGAGQSCQLLANARAQELRTVREYQHHGLKRNAVSLVDGIVIELRHSRCVT